MRGKLAVLAILLFIGLTAARPADGSNESKSNEEEDKGPVIGKGTVGQNEREAMTKEEDEEKDGEVRNVKPWKDADGASKIKKLREMQNEDGDEEEAPETSSHRLRRHGHRSHGRHTPPSFVSYLSATERKEYTAIARDHDLTWNEKREKMLKWAESKDDKKNLKEDVEKHLEEKSKEHQERGKQRREAAAALVEIVNKVEDMFEDGDKTREEIAAELKTLAPKENEQLRRLVFSMYHFLGGHGHGHHGKHREAYGKKRTERIDESEEKAEEEAKERPRRNIGHGAHPNRGIGNGVQGVAVMSPNIGHGVETHHHKDGHRHHKDKSYDPYRNGGYL